MPKKSYISTIDQYPDLKEISECLVCLTSFNNNDMVRVTICFHVFHVHCIDEWLKRH